MPAVRDVAGQQSAVRTLTALPDEDLVELVQTLGGKPFQARQLAHWVYRHGAATFAACRNLPDALKQRLASWGRVRGSEVVTVADAEDGARKLLLRLADGEQVESVLIPEHDRTTLCLSTQVGCPVGCVFCASGLDGVRRNLSTAEIVEQVLHARDLLPRGRALTNVVVMGMGEPLLNLEQLLPALARMHDRSGLDLGARRITVSTSGYPEQMARFAAAPHAYGLAVSLHAADDALRRRLVPNGRAPVAAILAAARHYFVAKGREVTFEVVLLRGVNDRDQDADLLVRRLRGLTCTVNLIPWNPVDRIAGLARPEPGRVTGFAARLRRSGLNVTVRRQRGADRDAACGQLRIRQLAAPGGFASPAADR